MQLAGDYQQARTEFLDAAARLDARISHYEHPLTGPDGGNLATDVAVLGSPDAKRRLLVISGTHGVEGFGGSLCETAWLRDGVVVPDDVAVVVIHALNPYGFAWIRRVNEDNVDLNRNGVDFGAPLPENPGYDELADALVPPVWDDATRDATTTRLLDFAGREGFDGLQAAVSSGQYRHPLGIFYGGRDRTWSHRTLEAIVRAEVSGAARVGIIDLHTGLGEFGHGELIASHPDAAARIELDRCFDGYVIPSEGTSVSADISGDVLDSMEGWLAGTPVAGVAIEWGTVDIVSVSDALRADAWLHGYADPCGPESGPIKEQLRAAFAPDDPQWASLVVDRFVEVRDRALDGLVS